MLQLISDRWWLLVLRGLLAIAFGIVAVVRPDLALVALVAVYGTFALLDGVLSLLGCLVLSGTRFVWWMLIEGLAGVGAGVVAFARPGLTAIVLLTFFGVWLIVSGVLRVVFAVEMRKVVKDDWLVALSGVCALAAGALTLARPLQTAVAWVWIMGAYAAAFGLIMLALGFSLRKLRTSEPPLPEAN